MKNAHPVSARRLLGLAAAALFAASACGKKETPRPAPAPVPTAAAAPQRGALVAPLGAATNAVPGENLPAWTQEPPHFYDRDGRRYACAVGWAVSANVALARTAAEDNARADLLRLLKGVPPGGEVEGTLSGARMTDSFTVEKGRKVFVRVEIPAGSA